VTKQLHIEVAYALPERQLVIPLLVDEGTSVERAIVLSGLLERRQDIDLAVNRVGVFSRPVKLTDKVSDGDRIEIYRPLTADPREIRRRRAERSKLSDADK
jgi:putative ubiquitin-RnfH superfamily antitoxin RatB of RatAB toxin-antitoxin module